MRAGTVPTTVESSKPFDWKMAIAGGLAGGISTGIIFPIDTMKTMIQTNSHIVTTQQAFQALLRNRNVFNFYAGVAPAVVGSIPSSALYFGTYETMKQILRRHCNDTLSRPFQHMIAASSGNIASSAVFVPKEVIKQQLQAFQSGSIPWTSSKQINAINVCSEIMRKRGLKGFYPSYRATLARNIPSAIVRFTIYEEFKRIAEERFGGRINSISLLFAGGLASGISSGLTTPLDVVKTRLSTGLLPPGSPVVTSLTAIAKKEGFRALYAGASTRIAWSALYGGIGLYSFECMKRVIKQNSSGPSCCK
jgi:solute carrier family 25 S-adenosylmethionine transporter 26